VDQNGKSVDCFLPKRRDVGAAKTFFRRAWKQHGDPLSITLDAYAVWHRAVPEFKESGEILYPKRRVRSCASLHPVVEQDHRGVKRRVNPMLGFQSLEKARVGIAGIELAQKISQRP
jgi:transposase-like protein